MADLSDLGAFVEGRNLDTLRRDPQEPYALHVYTILPSPFWDVHDAHLHLFAGWAAQDGAYLATIHHQSAQWFGAPAMRAGTLGTGHLKGKDLRQQTSRGVAVEPKGFVAHAAHVTHTAPPVGPKRSVLTRSGV